MRVIVICVFQILQMLVNHIGGWKCTLGHKRNTLLGGSGIQSRLQLSTFEYFTRKPTLELNYFEFNSIFEYLYSNPIQNLELKPLHEITAIALFAILSFKSFQLSNLWHFLYLFLWRFFHVIYQDHKNLCERQRIL